MTDMNNSDASGHLGAGNEVGLGERPAAVAGEEMLGAKKSASKEVAEIKPAASKSERTGPELTLVKYMPIHSTMYDIFGLIDQHKLELDTDIPFSEFGGVFLVGGAQSTGKTSLINRLLGHDILDSAQRVGTRVLTIIYFKHIHAHHSEEEGSIHLPALKKGQKTIKEELTEHRISIEEVGRMYHDFQEAIKDEKGEDEIITDVVEISITSSYIPTMIVIDTPGPPLALDRANKMSKRANDILKKYLDGTEFSSALLGSAIHIDQVHPLICFNANCDSSGQDFMATFKKHAKATLLNPSYVVNKIDESYDEKWKHRIVTTAKKGPYWKLEELLGDDEHTIIGLVNKDTTLTDQADKKARDQVEEEEGWVKARLRAEPQEISNDTAAKLTLPVLMQKVIDKGILIQVGSFLEKSKAKAEALEQATRATLTKLGTPPPEINPNDMKNFVQNKLGEALGEAIECMEEKILELVAKELEIGSNCAGGDTVCFEKCVDVLGLEESVEIASKRLLGGDFALETADILANKVRQPFAEDKWGSMQINRFEGLRDEYLTESRNLVDEKSNDFKKRAESVAKGFQEFIWYTDGAKGQDGKPIAKLENLIKGIIRCHKHTVVHPLFAELHNRVCGNEASVWDVPLIESHAKKRKELNAELEVLQKIIAGWDGLIKLLPDDVERVRNNPSPPPLPATPQMSPASNTRLRSKRAHEDSADDETSDKFHRTE